MLHTFIIIVYCSFVQANLSCHASCPLNTVLQEESQFCVDTLCEDRSPNQGSCSLPGDTAPCYHYDNTCISECPAHLEPREVQSTYVCIDTSSKGSQGSSFPLWIIIIIIAIVVLVIVTIIIIMALLYKRKKDKQMQKSIAESRAALTKVLFYFFYYFCFVYFDI